MASTTFPNLGKITSGFFEERIRPRLGASDPRVLVGPQNGVDSGILSLGAGQVLAVTTDPFFVVPEYGWDRAGWFAVHILASDLATSGLRPRWMSIDLNLPPSMTEAEFDALWTAVDRTCRDLGITVVTGHTGRYEGCAYPMIGGCTLMAQGSESEWVSVGQSQPGDAVIVTKSAAVEAAALMAASFPGQIRDHFDDAFLSRSERLFWKMSTVEDSLTAIAAGVRDQGVTAMHDATEGGVFGGIIEMANAARLGMRIDPAKVPLDDDIRAICDLYRMDPYCAISEGTLLLTCRPTKADDVLQALEEKNIAASIVGTCEQTRGVRLGDRTLEHPETDPFWGAFAKAHRVQAERES
ncbi:MAG: AIR synthase family protein [Myxococcota bacterium]